MTTFFSVLILVSSLTLIVSVVVQEGSEAGMGAISGGNSSDAWGKTKGTSRGAMLKKLTVVSAAVFMISALVLAAK